MRRGVVDEEQGEDGEFQYERDDKEISMNTDKKSRDCMLSWALHALQDCGTEEDVESRVNTNALCSVRRSETKVKRWTTSSPTRRKSRSVARGAMAPEVSEQDGVVR